MDQEILHTIAADPELYGRIQGSISSKLFNEDFAEIYEAIADARTKHTDKALSENDVRAVWLKNNPVATRSEREFIGDIIGSVFRAEKVDADIADEYVRELWRRHIGHKISNIGIEISQGEEGAMTRLNNLMEKTKEGLTPNDFGETTTKDLEELLKASSDDSRWKFNIETLSRHVYGIGPGEFGIVFATPETGKSAFVVSTCCGPAGFCEQGAKVLYLANEEKSDRTMLRAHMAWAGMTREEIAQDPRRAKDRFLAIADRLEMKDIQDWDMDRISAYCEYMKPDVLIIDQADKVHISGNFGASHERLRELYRSLRELAKRHELALVVVSQASAEAKGRTRLSPFEMEGSKIGKAAETDLIIGIGKHEAGDVDDSEPDHSRYLTVSKNKLSGWHGTIICQIQPEVSRYVE